MSLVKTREQKKALKAIELIFSGLDDDLLKQALLTAYAGEDLAILEAMKKQEQDDLAELLKQMELQSVEEVYDASCNENVSLGSDSVSLSVIEKSNDILDGNNTSNDALNKRHNSTTSEFSN